MELQDYVALDATSLARLIHDGEVSAEELLQTALTAAEKASHLNAIVLPMVEQAEQTLARGVSGPLAGVPFLIKDIVMVEGVRCSMGSALWQDFVPDHDAELVRRFRQAGLVTFGKTNTPEVGLAATTESTFLGPCLNPFDEHRTTGGSSGGAAAAVAAGIVPVAHATDGGGSIRIPASCCGLVGLKPTRARTPVGPDAGEGWGSMAGGLVVSRTVRDTAMLLDVTHGPMTGDPYHAPSFNGSFVEAPFSKAMKQAPKPMRIGIELESASGEGELSAECREGIERTAKLLKDLGHTVVNAKLSYDRAAFSEATYTLIASNVAYTVQARAATLGLSDQELQGRIETNTWNALQHGQTYTGRDYAAAVHRIHQTGRYLESRFADLDLIMSPTLMQPPVPLGFMNTDDGNQERYTEHLRAFWGYTHIYNATGNPAISLPLHFTEDGLPVGIQFAGPFGNEARLLKLARQLEEAQPWMDRYPFEILL